MSVEEHNIIGGLGGAIAEVLAKHYPVPMEFVGMQDCFGESGKPEELIEKYGLGTENIVKAAKRAIKENKWRTLKIFFRIILIILR